MVRRNVEGVALVKNPCAYWKINLVRPLAIRDFPVDFSWSVRVHRTLVAAAFHLLGRQECSAKIAARLRRHRYSQPLLLNGVSRRSQDIMFTWWNQDDLLLSSNDAVEILHTIAVETTVDPVVLTGLRHGTLTPWWVGQTPRTPVGSPDPRRIGAAPSRKKAFSLRSQVLLHLGRQ